MAINSLNASSHGLSGLASGMDTQAMVDAMLKGTQNKMDKANAKKTQLTYKQEMYQSVIGQLRTLSETFFSFSNKGTALNYDSFFNTMSAVTKSSAFKVTAGSASSTGKITVDYIKQLASATNKKSTKDATGKLEGTFDAAALQKVKDAAKLGLTFKAGDQEVKIDDLNAKLAGKTDVEAANILTTELTSIGVKVEFINGNFSFSTTPGADGKPVPLSITGTGTKLFGVSSTAQKPGVISSDKGVITKKGDLSLLQPSIDVTLNNVKKRITFDYNATTDINSMQAELQKSLTNAFGDEVKVEINGGKLSFKTKQTSSQVSITGGEENMKMLGIISGQSNKINVNMIAKNINFASPLYGDKQKFKINGVEFNVTSDRALSSIIDEINNSNAGVNIAYVPFEDRFTISSTRMGEGTDIQMEQTEGNLLSAMFGVSSGGSAEGSGFTSHVDLTGSLSPLPDDFTGGTVKITVNGTQYGINLPKVAKKDANGDDELDANGKVVYENYTPDKLVDEMNKQLKTVFGKTGEGATEKANIVMSLDNGKISIHSERGYNVELLDADTFKIFGFAGSDVRVTDSKAVGSTRLEDLGLVIGTKLNFNGLDVELEAGDTVDSLVAKVNVALNEAARIYNSSNPPPPKAGGTAAFDESTGRFRLFGVEIPLTMITSEDGEKVFGGKSMEFNSGEVAMDVTQGKDAIVSINGTEITRDSNSFTLEGVGFELLTTTQKKDADGNLVFKDVTDPITGVVTKEPVFEGPATVETIRDTEQIINGLKKFVEEYNKIVESIQDLTGQKATYKEYPPLTAEQKASMSESEIKLWEEKSREGLLRGDDALESVLSEMRRVLYQKSGSSEETLASIGITTYFSYSESRTGKFALDEEKLKERLAQNPDGVRKLFTDPVDGVATKFKEALDRSVSDSLSRPGKLVAIAGVKGRFDTSSTIYNQMKELDESLANLKRTYASEYQRYWKQFNAMEQMIQNMNSQSAWLSNQFSG